MLRSSAEWAIGFYENYGFKKVSPEEKDRLLKKYWKISENQIKNSVVLVDDFCSPIHNGPTDEARLNGLKRKRP